MHQFSFLKCWVLHLKFFIKANFQNLTNFFFGNPCFNKAKLQILQHQIIGFSRNLFPANLKDLSILVSEYRQMFDLIV